jgi:hypothetical protein
MTEKSILEQALLQVQNLEEAVKQNAKGILASTMKQELNDLLKESEEEDDELTPVEGIDSDEPNEEGTNDMSEQPEAEEGDEEDSENVDDLDNDDPSKDIESMDSEDEMSDDEETDEPDADNAGGLSDYDADNEDVMDMTGASDDEVLKVFKAMKPEDGIVVKKDGKDLNLDLGDDEYIIKLDGEESEMPAVDEFDFEDEEEETPELGEETIYEIELDEEEEEEIEVSEEESEEDGKEVEATEAARTFGADVRAPQGKKYKAGRHEMNEEVETLKKQNSEYKKALILFKEKLNEVAVFNANLAYATRLFTEHSTTKQEKLNILKRFDSISTMNEAKNLFSTIKSELGTKTTVTESVVDKISNTPSSSSSQEVLSEAKAYENPQFRRMKDLMGKIK